jgi:uncharacterized Zn finger protein (UPF0148 family)
MVKIVTCQKCSYRFNNENEVECPRCGHKYKHIEMSINEKIKLIDEISTISYDSKKNIKFENIQKRDNNIDAELSTNGINNQISVETNRKIDNFDEESKHALSFVNRYNEINNLNYTLTEKTEEDYDYSDRTITSVNDSPSELYIQITHFDHEIIAELGKENKYEGGITLIELHSYLVDTIIKKAKVDSSIRIKTILLLIRPTPIGQSIRQKIENMKFSKQGFREIWISTFHEKPFRIDN